ncbi:hypothetical protein ACLMJK_006358 [Lecanora helva]
MISLKSAILSLSLFSLNIFALPADVSDVEARATTPSMADTINQYITMIQAAGFKPNGQVGKRNAELAERAAAPAAPPPNINMVLALLQQHGFKPATTTAAKHTRDAEPEPEAAPSLEERDTTPMPDINLLISLLKQHGFYPTGKKTARSLEARQDANVVNNVIDQLVANGYTPGDFGSDAASLKTLALPTSATAVCPQNNNTLYSTGGQQYEVTCGRDYKGTELTPSTTKTLQDCLAACAKMSNCVAANWAPGTATCWPKSSISYYLLNNGYATGRNVKTTTPPLRG